MARIQLGILQALTSLPSSTEVSGAIGMLNSELMDITKLYGDFAEPFGLAECKLAIVHCAGHYDPTLIESLWRDIIDNGGWAVGWMSCLCVSVGVYVWLGVCVGVWVCGCVRVAGWVCVAGCVCVGMCGCVSCKRVREVCRY